MRDVCLAVDSGTLDGEVGAFHHSVGLRGARLCEPVLGILSASLVEKTDLVSGGTGLALEETVGELFPVVGEDGSDFERVSYWHHVPSRQGRDLA